MVELSKYYLDVWQNENLEHLRYEYDLKSTDAVLDIGSYRREFADEIIKRYGCMVECFDALDNRAAWVKDGQIKTGGAYYYTSMFSEGNTFYDCVDIAPFLKSEVALVKINIEGGEYELLNYIIDTGLIKNIKNIQVQFHLIEQDNDFVYGKLSDRLYETHKITWRYPFVWENWERL
jgi:hypothetical protein